jgi:histidinol dehydrogenase
MRFIRDDIEIATFLSRLKKRAAGASPDIEATVRTILNRVRDEGDGAVHAYTRRFDHHTLPLRVSYEEIRRAARQVDRSIRRHLEFSAKRIRSFHEKQREGTWSYGEDGAVLGQLIRPLARVGVYVPGGKASYPSTVLMNVIPAQVAGVEEIALCVPTPDGELNSCVMAALDLLGLREVYRIGGAQAVGAMAYGTESIGRVDKIVGPGNIFVAAAKRMVFGQVDIDMIAGPSEILIIADDSAAPSIVAADMLSQAEHDEMASSILITDSPALGLSVVEEVQEQLALLKRKDIARRSLTKFGAVIIARSISEAIELANRIAPEHLEIVTRSPRKHLRQIRNAGAVFLGPWTPEPLGDYSAGPNHTLPTGGTARFSSPLGVYDFVKKTSILEFSRKGFLLISDTVEALADVEGLEAHANTVRIRKALARKRR